MTRDIIKEYKTTELAYFVDHEIKKFRNYIYAEVREDRCEDELFYDYFNEKYINRVVVIRNISSLLAFSNVRNQIKEGRLYILIYDYNLSEYGVGCLDRLRKLILLEGSSFIQVCKLKKEKGHL